MNPTKEIKVRIVFKNGDRKQGLINIQGFDRLTDYLQADGRTDGFIKLYGDGNFIIIPLDSINYYQPL